MNANLVPRVAKSSPSRWRPIAAALLLASLLAGCVVYAEPGLRYHESRYGYWR